jgi:uncharacterized protein
MRIVIAHGASGSAATMQPHVDGLAKRGFVATAIDLPLRRAEAAVDAYRAATLALPEAREGLVIGGQSYGGRVASLLAAAEPGWAGLVLLCYPLHRPGHPDPEARIVHWPRLRTPVLLLSGEADPFARIDLLRRAVDEHLPHAELVTWPGLGHSLAPVLDEALDRVAAFVTRLAGAPAT